MEADKGLPVVRVEVVELDADGGRQIAARSRLSELLRDRAADIEAAITEATEIAGTALAASDDQPKWRVSSLEATFGLTLTAESGVLVTKAAAGASLEIKLTIERR